MRYIRDQLRLHALAADFLLDRLAKSVELVMDFGSFVRKRSLIYRYWNQIKAFGRRVLETWKAAFMIAPVRSHLSLPAKGGTASVSYLHAA